MTTNAGQTSYPSTDALIRAALDHVQAVFRGNGVRKDSIKVVSHDIRQLSMNAGTYLELKPSMSERTAPGKIVAGALVGSKEEAMQHINQAMIAAANDAAQKARIADVLLKRPDQGFGLSGQPIAIDFLKREYTWHEGCTTCRGSGHSPCVKCHGQKVESCIKCTGRGMMACPICMSTGLVQGVKCHRCHGQRFVPCDMCHRSGYMPCRTCHATGSMKCTSCGGVGWKSHIFAMQAQAVPYFEYERKSIPQGAADMIETGALRMAEEKRVHIRGRMADDRENVLGANYEVQFPFGQIVFQVGKQEVKANLFGYKAELGNFPAVLDKVLTPPVEELEQAARDVGSVADKIRKATRYRAIAQAYLNAPRVGPVKTMKLLLRTYDIGLTSTMAEKIAVLAENTMARITIKPRLHGLALGGAITAAINAVYYLLPVRSAIAGYLPDPKFDFLLDVPVPVIGGMITGLCIQFMARGAIQKALGHLMKSKKPPQNGKAQSSLVPLPRAGHLGAYGYAIAALLTLTLIEAAAQSGAAPHWYAALRSMISG